jgi:hypothetical protein
MLREWGQERSRVGRRIGEVVKALLGSLTRGRREEIDGAACDCEHAKRCASRIFREREGASVGIRMGQ